MPHLDIGKHCDGEVLAKSTNLQRTLRNIRDRLRKKTLGVTSPTGGHETFYSSAHSSSFSRDTF